MTNPEKPESADSDIVTSMPGGAMPPAPEVSGDASGVSILSLAGDVASPLVDAEPLLGRDGQPKRKPGRPKKSVPTPDTPAPSILFGDAPAPVVKTPKTPAQNRAARVASDELARAILNTSVGAMCALVGPEWDFQSPEEAGGMKLAVSAYIEAKGDGNISPESMLLLVVAGYALPRAAHENTRTKIGGFFAGLLNGFKSLFKR